MPFQDSQHALPYTYTLPHPPHSPTTPLAFLKEKHCDVSRRSCLNSSTSKALNFWCSPKIFIFLFYPLFHLFFFSFAFGIWKKWLLISQHQKSHQKTQGNIIYFIYLWFFFFLSRIFFLCMWAEAFWLRGLWSALGSEGVRTNRKLKCVFLNVHL